MIFGGISYKLSSFILIFHLIPNPLIWIHYFNFLWLWYICVSHLWHRSYQKCYNHCKGLVSSYLSISILHLLGKHGRCLIISIQLMVTLPIINNGRNMRLEHFFCNWQLLQWLLKPFKVWMKGININHYF